MVSTGQVLFAIAASSLPNQRATEDASPLYRLCAPRLKGYSRQILTQSCVPRMAFFSAPTPTKVHRPLFDKCSINMCSRATLAGGYAPDFVRKQELACTSRTRIPLIPMSAKQMRGPGLPLLTNVGYPPTHWHFLQTLEQCEDSATGITVGPDAQTPIVHNGYTPAEEAFTRPNRSWRRISITTEKKISLKEANCAHDMKNYTELRFAVKLSLQTMPMMMLYLFVFLWPVNLLMNGASQIQF
ncbi:hypothetical protein KP509_04G064600 [Ceratopteris richardii]|uniref:Uncharacterized protein n=1 Tax=Ceratopteris richardii TaxID=49495 RepID=A0A8T2V150_CERRI|nr:hypothetical protein KP509_04G064600 [Ceratopteris richardii]